MTDLRPRQYAFGTVDPKTGERLTPGIAGLKTREERMKALGEVPQELRGWVEDLVKDAYQYTKGRREAIEKAVAERKRRRS